MQARHKSNIDLELRTFQKNIIETRQDHESETHIHKWDIPVRKEKKHDLK